MNNKTIGISVAVIAILIAGILTFVAFNSNNKPAGNSNQTSPTPSQSTSASDSSKCMVTIMGKSYDVTKWRSVHPGGDVFVCGTDMTKQYVAQHGSDPDRIDRYLSQVNQ